MAISPKKLVRLVANPGVVDFLDSLFGGDDDDRRPSGRARNGDAGEPSARERADYQRLHWDQPNPVTRSSVEFPGMPKRFSKLGVLTGIRYLTEKGDEGVQEFDHSFGKENGDGTFEGVRPLLVVGFYDDGRPEELFILRDKSRYRVKRPGIIG